MSETQNFQWHEEIFVNKTQKFLYYITKNFEANIL